MKYENFRRFWILFFFALQYVHFLNEKLMIRVEAQKKGKNRGRRSEKKNEKR